MQQNKQKYDLNFFVLFCFFRPSKLLRVGDDQREVSKRKNLADRHHYLKQDDPSGLVPLDDSASQLGNFRRIHDPIVRYFRSGFSSHEVPSPAGRAAC